MCLDQSKFKGISFWRNNICIGFDTSLKTWCSVWFPWVGEGEKRGTKTPNPHRPTSFWEICIPALPGTNPLAGAFSENPFRPRSWRRPRRFASKPFASTRRFADRGQSPTDWSASKRHPNPGQNPLVKRTRVSLLGVFLPLCLFLSRAQTRRFCFFFLSLLSLAPN